MTRIMDSVLQDAKPQVRAAGAPYLLCLVKYCPGHALVQARLKLVQQHFSFMLSEKSEFMQEVASKGIGLVYDMCDDEAVKDELVATLAKGLMSGTIEAPTKAARQVMGTLKPKP
jgi:proteasome component ECM29